jgi:2-amino-4-hydroxy-6-hydroxymethyldihydropteridine diphosphokinase
VTRAVLSIGANLGDARAAVLGAIAALGEHLTATSGLYRTPPWGGVEQDDFVNATVLADDPARSAADWLDFAREQETAARRVRDVHWGPRTLDVDVIAVWEDGVPIRSDDPELTLPHPRAQHRAFVLVPWSAADPAAELPGHGPVRRLIAALPADEVGQVRAL